MSWTADTLLASVKVKAGWPSSGGYLTNTEILSLADDETLTTIAPILRATREEYLVSEEDQTLVSGTALYSIPARALGSSLRDVLLVTGSQTYSLPEIPPEELWRYETSAGPGWRAPYGFCLQAGKLRLLPGPVSSGDTLRLRYHRRPSRLVTVAEAGVVSSTGATTITLSATAPTGWGASATLDVISHLPPYDAVSDDLSATIVGTGVTVAAGVSSSVGAGHYVSLKETTPIPQMPVELHPLLVLCTARSCASAAGDMRVAGALQAQAMQAEDRVRGLLKPRVLGERPVVINRYSALRGGRRWGR